MVIEESPVQPSGVTVLLVDSNTARREVLQFMLESPGIGATVVGTASDPASALVFLCGGHHLCGLPVVW